MREGSLHSQAKKVLAADKHASLFFQNINVKDRKLCKIRQLAIKLERQSAKANFTKLFCGNLQMDQII